MNDVQRPPRPQLDDPSIGDLDTLFASVEAGIAQEDTFFGRLRQRAVGFRVGLLLASIATFALLGAILFPRSDLGEYVHSRLMLDLSMLGALIAAACMVAFWPLHRPALPRWTHAVLQAASLALLTLVALFPGLQDHAKEGFTIIVLEGLACASRGLIVGAIVFVLTRALDRGAERSGWAAAALAGLAANLALLFVCADDWYVHRLVGHVAVSFVFSAAVTSGVVRVTSPIAR